MCEDKIKEVVTRFAKETKRIYGSLIYDVILYGSCARGTMQRIVTLMS